MTTEFVAGFIYEALKTTILLGGPILLCGLVAGLLVSIFQTATSINEMTLVFIPKMAAVGIALLIFFPWMLDTLVTFTQKIFISIPTYIH
jgi:flagellar biosynthetic protein FliQ